MTEQTYDGWALTSEDGQTVFRLDGHIKLRWPAPVQISREHLAMIAALWEACCAERAGPDRDELLLLHKRLNDIASDAGGAADDVESWL